MIDVTEILKNATTGIGKDFFLLPVSGGARIYRERVYCYELYHQMRKLWPEKNWFRLNGEIDKRAHPYFEGGVAHKPDLLIYDPGSNNNYAIIEVKCCSTNKSGIEKDLRVLETFKSKFGYKRAIYLIFGSDSESIVPTIQALSERNGFSDYELFLHSAAAKPCFAAWL